MLQEFASVFVYTTSISQLGQLYILMEIDLDVALHHLIEKALELAQCRVGCLLVVDIHAPGPGKILGVSWRKQSSEESDTNGGAPLPIADSSLSRLLSWNVEIGEVPDGLLAQDLKFLGAGQCRILKLAKHPSFQVLLLLNSDRKIRVLPNVYDALLNLGNYCVLVLERCFMRRSAEQAGYNIDFLGFSQPFRQMEARIQRFSQIADVPVLITGERGTGKEAVAYALHYHSARKNKPFLAINVGALSTELYAAELFGFRKGAFSGALSDRPGKFQAAEGGTLFLDEITELPEGARAGLLRALDQLEIQKLGDDRPSKIDLRIVAATNKNIRQLVAEGKFPADLFDRLNVLSVQVPPLRERKEDIPLLAHYFFRKYCGQFDGRAPHLQGLCRLCAQAGESSFRKSGVMSSLMAYSWPGNVRELRNTLIQMMAESDGPEICLNHLPIPILNDGLPVAHPSNSDCRLDSVIRQHILRTLEQAQWNKSAAARTLGLPLSTLVSKLKYFKISPPAERPQSRQSYLKSG